MYCMNCGQELPDVAKFCFKCGNRVENNVTESSEIESAVSETNEVESAVKESNEVESSVIQSKEINSIMSEIKTYMEQYCELNDMQAEEMPVNKSQSNSNMTLAEFRLKAPAMEGFREELLAYRKSLSNSWDYNAYVGILLGVGGSKHGDAACMNFAIGQGDNGNNTKKTLENKGLMSVFEKYKGKKIDSSIKLSDVEDEIISIVPQYASIRSKLSTYLSNNANSENVNSNVAQNVKNINTTNITNTVNTTNTTASYAKEPAVKTQENVLPQLKPFVKKEEDTLAQKYKSMKCHSEYYSFAGGYELGSNMPDLRHRVNCSNLVQEYEGNLYYFKNNSFYKLPIQGSSESTVIAKFSRQSVCNVDRRYSYGPDFSLGATTRFCVNKGRIYFSRPQIEGRTLDNNEIWSFSLSNPKDMRKEFELIDKEKDFTIYSPYVIGNRVLVGTYAESYDRNEKHLLSQSGNNKTVAKIGEYSYLGINEEGYVLDCDTAIAVNNIISDTKMPIKKAYKGLKDKNALFIDSQRDILYYLEEEGNVTGNIIGISKNGEIVDKWKAITDIEFLKAIKAKSGYSSFYFDGNLRTYKITSEFYDRSYKYEDCIYAVDREGNCDKRFEHQYNDVNERCWGSVLHIQTPNAVVVHFESKNTYTEYMISTTGEHQVKKL